MYRPPEIADPFLRYRVNQKADVWMLGCVLYTLCYFAHPFVESNKLAISQALFKIPKNSKYSHKINDLIRHMLTPNPQNRPSITDILNITRTWNQLAAIPLNVHFYWFRPKQNSWKLKENSKRKRWRNLIKRWWILMETYLLSSSWGCRPKCKTVNPMRKSQ